MSSIYLSKELKTRLIAGARRRGFKVERGPASELKDYVAYLLSLDEERPPSARICPEPAVFSRSPIHPTTRKSRAS